MTKDQCISVTDLRTKTKQCLQGLEKKPKYIFVNNKPVAVLIDIEAYDNCFFKTELIELPEDEVTPELMKKAEEALKIPKQELNNLK